MGGSRDGGSAQDSSSFLITWSEYCDLLDSMPLDCVISRQVSGERFDRRVVDWARERLTSGRQYFCEINRAKLAIELFWLKLTLVEAISSEVVQCHERHGRIFGVIDPQMVSVELPRRSSGVLPNRWAVRVTLLPALREEMSWPETMPEEMARGMASVPRNADLAFASPEVKHWPQGREVPVTAIVESIDAIPHDDRSQVRGLVRVHIIADEIVGGKFSDRDVFGVVLPVATDPVRELFLWSRKVDSSERGLMLSGVTESMAQSDWDRLVQSTGQVRSTAKAVVYRVYSIRADLYSCGMLLLRALLGADMERWRRVVEAIPAVIESLGPLVQGLDHDDHFTVYRRVKERMRDWGDLFDCPAVPQDLWWDGMVAVLRACSPIEGFGYGVGKEKAGESPLREFTYDLGCLGRRARFELFEAGERDRMIAQACDRVLAKAG